MKMPDVPKELSEKFVELANEIYQKGYDDGFQFGVMVWAVAPVYEFNASAGGARLDPATLAPTGESWEEMHKRETEAGAKTLVVTPLSR